MRFQYLYGMQVHLGVGWEPQQPLSNKLIGGYLQVADPSDQSPNATDRTEQKFINNFQEFEETTRLSLSAKGKGSFGVYKVSGSASYSQERSIFRNSRNVVWSISVKRTYDPISAVGVKLTQSGEGLFEEIRANKDISKLKKRVGSHIVTSISREAEITLLYVFTASSSSKTSDIRAAISAHVSGATGGGGVDSTFEQSVRNVDNSVRLDFMLVHAGIDDSSGSLSDILAIAPGDLSEVRRKVGEAISSISWDRSPITEFGAEPLADVFDLPSPDYSAEMLETRKSRIQDMQRRVIQRILELDDLLELNRTSEIELAAGAEDEIRLEINKLDRNFQELEAALLVATENPDEFTGYPTVKIPYGKLHWIKLDFGSFLQWKASASGHYDNNSERVVATATFWPEFYVKSTDFIGRMELVRNGVTVFSLSQQELRENTRQGRLDGKGFYSSSHSLNEYCWRGHWGETCNPWAADATGHKNSLKANERQFTYQWRVVDIENNVHEFKLPNPADQQY
ncbi:hypothetical protein [Ruegeria denitrificans]|uniref:hypothetical protein n=1 Tax=Ruegeria denitrificans TaxID=1715692 RepID=UPI003C7C3330